VALSNPQKLQGVLWKLAFNILALRTAFAEYEVKNDRDAAVQLDAAIGATRKALEECGTLRKLILEWVQQPAQFAVSDAIVEGMTLREWAALCHKYVVQLSCGE
jgi:hypothetical protein